MAGDLSLGHKDLRRRGFEFVRGVFPASQTGSEFFTRQKLLLTRTGDWIPGNPIPGRGSYKRFCGPKFPNKLKVTTYFVISLGERNSAIEKQVMCGLW